MESSILSQLRVNLNGEDKIEGDEDISIEDIQPDVLSPMEVLTAIRKLDCYLKSSNDKQKVLHSLPKTPSIC